ncbi:MAG TPA: phosphotransferase [Armatimonadota bacterium]|jgi:hypothetical protein
MDSEAQTSPLEVLAPDIALALAGAFGHAVRLAKMEPLGGSSRSHVARCRILDAPEGVPASVVVKQAKGDDDGPFNPDVAPPSSPAWRFYNDWVGAQLLTEVCPRAQVGPRFLGGHRSLGFIILEDLGEGESLADVLLGDSSGRARDALMAFAAALGRMHSATVGREDDCRRLRDALTPPLPKEAAPAPAPYSQFREACGSLGVALPSEAEKALEAVAASMSEPGPFLAYTHGDPCPDNTRLLDGGLRLIDFEFGAYRHALLDGVYGRLPFPTCWCANRLPSEIPSRMEAAYRAELVKGCPEASADALFLRAVVEATAHWTCNTTGWHLPGALEGDHEWGVSTMRQRVLLRLDNLAVLTEESGHLEPLGAGARAMAQRLRAVWPADIVEMPLYPAFR